MAGMREPTAVTRPDMAPGYGISADPDGMLPWEWAVEQLTAARNYWICTTRADGRPHAAPVWGLWRDDGVLFGTSPASVKGRNLARDPRFLIHTESGDDVVILEGVLEKVPFDDAAADAYEAKYAFRPETTDGGWNLLRPAVALAWREQDFPNSATRFAF
jgi:Pyridoxamine 5'-phosphate oxidase